MTTTNEQAIQVLRMIATAIVSTVKEMGSTGAPASSLYMAMTTHGCTLTQFEQIMAALVGAGQIHQENNVYYAN